MATIAENLQTILDIKNDIKSAIIAKGVSVADTDGFATYSSKIANIETGGDGFDFGTIGYNTTLNDSCNNKIKTEINLEHSISLYNEWNTETTSAVSLYSHDIEIVYAPLINTSNVTNMYGMYEDCENLICVPPLNTTNVYNMDSMFGNCKSLQTIPMLDTSNVFYFDNMFYGCSSLQTIPILDTSNAVDVAFMFQDCISLQSLPLLDFGNVTRISGVFAYSDITTLTDLGGFKNLKINWNDNNGLYRLPNLTYESVMNVINNLYDFRNNGDDTTTRTIQFNSNSKALLSESDIAIATNKGWVIS